jgi:hypothetical protein
MLFPSFLRWRTPARTWNVAHAAFYGAVIGAAAAAFKTFGPYRADTVNLSAGLLEIGEAVLAFALLCAIAAVLRNFLARQLIWHDGDLPTPKPDE